MITTTLVLSLVNQVHLALTNVSAQLLSAPFVGASSLAPLLAVTTVETAVDGFLNFMAKLMIVPALALTLFAAYQFSEGRLRESGMSFGGALLMALAVPIVRAIFGF